MSETNHLLLVDSFALLFRGYYASAMYGPPKANSKGLYTNGLQQFLRYLFDAVHTFKPTHVACAIDMGKETFRNQLFPDYKSNRGAPPAELVPQFSLLRNVLEAYDIPCVGVEGFEADDLLGSMAAHYAERGVRVSILSGDGDVLQLLRPGVEVILMKKGFSNYDTVRAEHLSEYKGLRHAAQIVELKALMGDSSDFIPGCPNVGPKTALKLLQEHGDVAGVFAAAEQLPVKLRDNLLAHRAQIELSRELATIRCDVPFACVLDQSALGWNDAVMKQTLTELGMRPQSK